MVLLGSTVQLLNVLYFEAVSTSTVLSLSTGIVSCAAVLYSFSICCNFSGTVTLALCSGAHLWCCNTPFCPPVLFDIEVPPFLLNVPCLTNM
ncbi:hypothetical protein BDV28DRAFT_55772 [Aspergillus coremiiformis]|uniref:Uncharacterized protein n=1 Tax=Aspergillus coremiiformis TaxID=138285 RepID=A0A5N6ZE54_9EURO|nr:hypothetical protein BDV28DRAFT_55772 [Aspergillus coremiiformis]